MFGWLKKVTGGARKNIAPPVPAGLHPEDVPGPALERLCAPITFRQPANIDPFASMFGTVRLARKDEPWPTHAHEPLWPLCQLNLTHAPLRPDALHNVSLITVFIAPQHAEAPTHIIDTRMPDPNATWALRSYPTLQDLTIPQNPAHGSTLSPRLGEWGPITPDYAGHDPALQVADTAAHGLHVNDGSGPVQQTKLGGWPATAQSDLWWDRQKSSGTWDFVLQLSVEPAALWQGWGDGAAYIARSRQRPHLWAIDVQFT